MATLSPGRPNPIALSACALLCVDKEIHRLEIAYKDTEDGTPVLDIKPYEPSGDLIRNVRMPS